MLVDSELSRSRAMFSQVTVTFLVSRGETYSIVILGGKFGVGNVLRGDRVKDRDERFTVKWHGYSVFKFY